MNRRSFLSLSSTITAGLTLAPSTRLLASVDTGIKAIVFDAFPILDPTPVFKLAKELYPEKGAELVKEWKTRQFEYTWLRSMTNSYQDFLAVTEDALVFATNMLQLKLDNINRTQLVNSYYQLQIWPEVAQVLTQLNKAGYRLGILSNFTPKMLETGVKNANIENQFEHLISTDEIKKYKPDPSTYQMAMDTFNLKKSEILFVPFAGWDAAGAKMFGYKTFWINHLGLPVEQLSVHPDGTGNNLNDLLAYLK